MSEPQWIRVTDELPACVERFRDGTEYHGKVEGWFPYFAKNNRRDTSLFTHPEEPPRWMVSGAEGLARAKEPPTHWRRFPGPPDG